MLGVIAKFRRSPAKQTKLVSLETPCLSPPPPPLPPPETNKSSHFKLQVSDQCVQNTIWSPKCDFFRIPLPPKRILFVSLGFCELLRWPLCQLICRTSCIASVTGLQQAVVVAVHCCMLAVRPVMRKVTALLNIVSFCTGA